MSEVLQWHVTWSSQGRRPLAPDEARRRALVREVAARAGASLVLFSLVDDHLHVWLMGERSALVKVVRSLGFALRTGAAAPVLAPHIEPVERRGHAEWLVAYLLTQTTHHGVAVHPARWAGSAVADLLGARLLGAWRTRLWDALPRLRLGDVHAAVGLPDARLVPAGDDDLRALGVGGLVQAAAATFAAAPSLESRGADEVLALRAAARLARDVGLSPSALGEGVGRSRESIWRASTRPMPEATLRAVRLRVALDQASTAAVVPPLAAWKEGLSLRRRPRVPRPALTAPEAHSPP